jgi:hypothetical protein
MQTDFGSVAAVSQWQADSMIPANSAERTKQGLKKTPSGYRAEAY